MKFYLCLWLSLFIFCSVNVNAQKRLYYRYISENGVTVISSQIPSRYVSRGYDIITEDGKLVERVPPELPPEEKKRMLKQQQEAAQLKAWDKELLRRYSHPDDIEAAKQRKLNQNKTDLGIVLRNIEKVNDDINRYQGLAAADERAGRKVAKDTLDKIESLKRDRESELAKKEKKEMEQQAIIEKYDRDIERFKVIRPNTVSSKR